MSQRQAYDAPGTHDRQAALPPVAAADPTADFVVFEAPVNCRIEKVKVIPGAAVTGADTNTRHLNLVNRGANGAGAAEVANYDLTSGNGLGVAGLVLYAPAVPLAVVQGTQLALQIEKVGTGIALPPLGVVVEFSPN